MAAILTDKSGRVRSDLVPECKFEAYHRQTDDIVPGDTLYFDWTTDSIFVARGFSTSGTDSIIALEDFTAVRINMTGVWRAGGDFSTGDLIEIDYSGNITVPPFPTETFQGGANVKPSYRANVYRDRTSYSGFSETTYASVYSKLNIPKGTVIQPNFQFRVASTIPELSDVGMTIEVTGYRK